MTPDERYALQAALGDLESAAQRIRDILNLGTNPHISAAEYKVNLMKQMHRCRCEFGWQPDCPQHRDPDARYIEDHQRTSYHREDHQDERPAWEKSLPGVANALADEGPQLPSPPAWYGQVDTTTEDRLIEQQHYPTPKEIFGD